MLAFLVALSCPGRALAWPGDLSRSIATDAFQLLPKSLADLLVAHQGEIFSEARISKSQALALVYSDLPKGRLGVTTRAALGDEALRCARALQGEEFKAAVISLGSTYRLAVDLADPGVGAGLGIDEKARAIRREFYLYVTSNRDKIPLVVAEPASLKLRLDALPGFLGEVMQKASAQAALLRAEGQESGRVLKYTEIDFRSPVFAVASTAYSRSVGAVAATWIAIWRSAGGDLQRQKKLRTITPRAFGINQEPIS